MERHQAGELIGDRFCIIGILESGGIGTTYEATDEQTQTCVALKALYFNYLNARISVFL
ncbi:MAG: hypothetical protein J7647_20990 [Cyanobacteria bacterium SBLK]|nr:hypothetical protein [Cyanobacteria bacterium SBLK]